MGLTSGLQKIVKAAFTAIGDLSQSVTYVRQADPSYDVATGVVTESYTSETVNVVLVYTKAIEVDNKAVLRTDQWMLVPYIDLSVTPTNGDEVIIDTETWTVKEVYKVIQSGVVLWKLLIEQAK